MKIINKNIKYIILICIIILILYYLIKIIYNTKEYFNDLPIVTFIIPTIGRDTLSKTIKSLKNQTKRNWKAIIIFDGIQPTISDNDERISIIQIEKKGKLNHAGRVRNSGIEFVDTEWVAFVDDDDTITPNYLEIFENELDDNWDVIIFRMLRKGIEVLPPFGEIDFEINKVGISFSAKTSLFKVENLWFGESSVEDYELLDKFRNNNKHIKISNEITYIVG
jgi:glycosyltransferase involved in cell wall biosynthesis